MRRSYYNHSLFTVGRKHKAVAYRSVLVRAGLKISQSHQRRAKQPKRIEHKRPFHETARRQLQKSLVLLHLRNEKGIGNRHGIDAIIVGFRQKIRSVAGYKIGQFPKSVFVRLKKNFWNEAQAVGGFQFGGKRLNRFRNSFFIPNRRIDRREIDDNLVGIADVSVNGIDGFVGLVLRQKFGNILFVIQVEKRSEQADDYCRKQQDKPLSARKEIGVNRSEE